MLPSSGMARSGAQLLEHGPLNTDKSDAQSIRQSEAGYLVCLHAKTTAEPGNSQALRYVLGRAAI